MIEDAEYIVSNARGSDMDSTTQLTQAAADALVALYGDFNADYLANVFSAGWMTEAERKVFQPLVDKLRAVNVEHIAP